MKKIMILTIASIFLAVLSITSLQSESLCKDENASYQNFMSICEGLASFSITQKQLGGDTPNANGSPHGFCHCIFFETNISTLANSSCQYNYDRIGKIIFKDMTIKRVCGHLQP